MAGSIVVTTSKVGALNKYSVAWVSSAGGAVSANAFPVVTGELMQVTFIPDGGGTQPTNLYDVTMTDANGVDVLGGLGADLSNSASAVVRPSISTSFPRILEGGDLMPVVANAGNAKGGTIQLLVRPL